MTRKAAVPVPPRIKDDFDKNDARSLKMFLQNIKERVDNLSSRMTAVEGRTTSTSTSSESALGLTLADFESTLSADGYITLPGGLILQWGTFTNNVDTEQTVNFPVAFASSCWGVFVNRQVAGVSAPIMAITFTTTSFGVNRVDTIDGSETLNWFAIGM